MKKIFKKLFVLTILAVGIISTTACNKSQTIVGKWEHSSGYIYNFKDNKTGIYSYGSNEMKFTYKDDGKKLSILFDGNTIASEYEYRIENNKLIIKDSFGKDVEYIKK